MSDSKLSIQLPDLPLPVMSLDQVSRLLMVVGSRERMLIEALASARMHLQFGDTDLRLAREQRDALIRSKKSFTRDLKQLKADILPRTKEDLIDIVDMLIEEYGDPGE